MEAASLAFGCRQVGIVIDDFIWDETPQEKALIDIQKFTIECPIEYVAEWVLEFESDFGGIGVGVRVVVQSV
jgi:hypothetical protein